MQKKYYTYIMTNNYNRVFYTGMTHDLAGRVWQHKQGTINGFTKWYKAHKLIYYEEFNQVEAAIRREKQIKGWLRAKKIALIESVNKDWEDLSADWY